MMAVINYLSISFSTCVIQDSSMIFIHVYSYSKECSSLNVLGGAEVLAFSFYRKGNNKKYQVDVSQDDRVRWCT